MLKKEIQPEFIELKDREKFDLTRLAQEIYEKGIGGKKKRDFLEKNWNKDENQWKVFFGFDMKYFLNEIDLIIRKMEFPELFKKKTDVPTVIPEGRDPKKLSMGELKEYCPEYWKKLSDNVFEKFKDKDGNYFSAESGFKSKSKLKFEIDHIIPISKGGLTKLDNLQLLTRQENRDKGNKPKTKKRTKTKPTLPANYLKLWKKYQRNPDKMTGKEKSQLSKYIDDYGLP